MVELNILALQNGDLLEALSNPPEGGWGRAALANHIGRDPSNTSRALKALADAGLLGDPPLTAGLTGDGAAQLAAYHRARHGGEKRRARGQWPADRFRPNPLNRPVRHDLIPEMAESMLGPAGLVQRIKATAPDANGVRMIIDGEHRWEAAKLLIQQDRTPEWLAEGIPFEEGEADEATALVVTLVANARRADMTPWEDAQQLLKLQKVTDWSAAELARQIGRVAEGETRGLRDVQQKLKIAREATPEAIADYDRTGSWDALRDSVSNPRPQPVAPPPTAPTPDAPPSDIVTTKAQRLALAEIWHKAGRTLDPVAILPAGHTAEGARLAQYGLATLIRSDRGDTAMITQAGVDYLASEGLSGGIEGVRARLGFPEGYGVTKLRTEWLNAPGDDNPWLGRGWTHVQTRNAPAASVGGQVRDASLTLFRQSDGFSDRYRARFSVELWDHTHYVNDPIPGPSSSTLAYQMAIEDFLKHVWPEAPRALIEWADRIAGPFVVAGKDRHNATRAQEARYDLGWEERKSNSGGAPTRPQDGEAQTDVRLTVADFGVPSDWSAGDVLAAAQWLDRTTHTRLTFEGPGLQASIQVAKVKGGEGWVNGSSASTGAGGHASTLNGVWTGRTVAYQTQADAVRAAAAYIAETIGAKMSAKMRKWLDEAPGAMAAITAAPSRSDAAEADQALTQPDAPEAEGLDSQDAEATTWKPPAAVMSAHLRALAESREHPTNAALRLIADERRRQVEKEGWSPDHDDQENSESELAMAAAAYCAAYPGDPDAALWWPSGWDSRMFKPQGDIHDLVRAGALIVAELERRARQTTTGTC